MFNLGHGVVPCCEIPSQIIQNTAMDFLRLSSPIMPHTQTCLAVTLVLASNALGLNIEPSLMVGFFVMNDG